MTLRSRLRLIWLSMTGINLINVEFGVWSVECEVAYAPAEQNFLTNPPQADKITSHSTLQTPHSFIHSTFIYPVIARGVT